MDLRSLIRQSRTVRRTPMLPGLLACALSLAGERGWCDIRVTRVDIDGRAREIASGDSRPPEPIAVPSTARSVGFHFVEAGPGGGPTSRLRYRLEGHDSAWRDLPVKMRAIIYFLDRRHAIVGSTEFEMVGESPGWRDTIEASVFVARRGEAVAPARSATVRISFISHGGQAGMGVLGVDAVRVRVQSTAGERTRDFDLGVSHGSDLTHPLGSPGQWIREGSRGELAQLLVRPTPSPHPILVIRDDDPSAFGNWATGNDIPTAPGDRVTLEWETAHSIGGSSPGHATYAGLKPGRYWFRVAAARASGELTGEEVSLPVEVFAPLHHRPQFWAGLAVLAGGATLWARQVVARRRMQRRLAELEREQALERERARIARDLHDDVGAGLAEIAMQSDWVLGDLDGNPSPQTRGRVERIRESATELARGVDGIVWATNPANDNLRHFASYLTEYSAKFCEAAGLRVRFDVPPQLPELALAGKVRHHFLMAVREALHNVAKHAGPSLVRIGIVAGDGRLRVSVQDDGRGFDPGAPVAGGTREGIENMRRRMEEIGGEFCLESRPGVGARLEFCAPLAHPALCDKAERG